MYKSWVSLKIMLSNTITMNVIFISFKSQKKPDFCHTLFPGHGLQWSIRCDNCFSPNWGLSKCVRVEWEIHLQHSTQTNLESQWWRSRLCSCGQKSDSSNGTKCWPYFTLRSAKVGLWHDPAIYTRKGLCLSLRLLPSWKMVISAFISSLCFESWMWIVV